LNQHIGVCPVSQRFGRILRKSRTSAKLSPEQLSQILFDCCGVHYSARTIYRYECGTHPPSLEFLVTISLMLDSKIFNDLLTEILSPGLVGDFNMQEASAYFDNSGQLRLFA
jgi:transcriptional regulator with XRE-family HTH domain